MNTNKDSLGARRNRVIHTPAGLNFKDYTMKLIPLTQGKFAIIDDDKYDWLMKYKWYARKTKRTYYAIRNYGYKKQYMHRMILGLKPGDGKLTDHKNRKGLDNRIGNLRICNYNQNARNCGPNKEGSSRYKGVFWYKRDKIWRAAVYYKYKPICIGHFDNEIEAAKAYDKKVKELFGEFAYLNFR